MIGMQKNSLSDHSKNLQRKPYQLEVFPCVITVSLESVKLVKTFTLMESLS